MNIINQMFGSNAIEIILGLGFVALAMGIVCTLAAELVSILLNADGRRLQESVAKLGDADLADELYKHPLVASFYDGKSDKSYWRNLPSYVPPDLLALALLDVVTGSSGRPSFPGYPTDSFDWLAPARVREAINMNVFPRSSIQRSLNALITASGDDAKELLANVEGLFSSILKEVSDWGRRFRNVIVALLAFLLCGLFNIDALDFANYFATARAQSAFWLQNSNASSSSNNSTGNSFASTANALLQIRGLGPPLGWSASTSARLPSSPNDWVLKIECIILMGFGVCACGIAFSELRSHLQRLRHSRAPTTREGVTGVKSLKSGA